MPRYRFDWENIDPTLRSLLCPGAADGSSTASLLRARFGARPRTAFVEECWDVLRDDWLVHDHTARHRVVSALRPDDTSSHGDGSGAVADEEVAFLRSYGDMAVLGPAVLAEFIRLGEGASGSAKAARSRPSWATFRRSLAEVLAGLQEDQCLILSVRGTGAGRVPDARGSSYFVQFVSVADAGMRAEAVSNTFLTEGERLGPDAQVRLVQLGWQPPTHLPGGEEDDPTGSVNYYRDWAAPVPADSLADMAATTLREVYGADRPAFLEYRAFTADGSAVDMPGLGLAPEPMSSNVAAEDPEALLPKPATPEALRAEVARALRPILAGDEVLYDDDGDIPIRFGSTQVYVRSSESSPVVRVFALLLTDLTGSAVLIEAINELNQGYLFGKFYWDGTSVVLALDVPAIPFVGSHLTHAVVTVGQIGDELDEGLQERFGGRTFFGARGPSPEPEQLPGYL